MDSALNSNPFCIINLCIKPNVESVEQKSEEDFTIDITNQNNSFVYCDKFPLSNVTYETFSPHLGAIITSVRDDNGVIWEGSRGIYYVLVLLKYDKPYLVRIQLASREVLYFVKSDGKWTEITLEEFKDNFVCLKDSVEEKERITLDGDIPKNSRWTIREFKFGKTNQVLFYTNIGYEATAVVARRQVVWNAKNNERCVLAIFFYYKNKALLTHLFVNDGNSINNLYYRYANEQWLDSDENEYVETANSHAPPFASFEIVNNPIGNVIGA